MFESMGRPCVRRLVAVPHPFGLAPEDRRAARRWLNRRASARQRRRDLARLLGFVALGLAAGLVALTSYSAPPHSAAMLASDANRMAGSRH